MNRFGLEGKWSELLKSEFEMPYMKQLDSYLDSQEKQGVAIYPPEQDRFNAFRYTPFERVKVVILGQDPYHGPGQAHGLSFSVKDDIKIPPSLRNIYKELEQDLGIPPAAHGNLTAWAEQGVLLLNNVLTVAAGSAGSHQNQGWELFTDKVVDLLNTQASGLVFLLWGSHAQKKGNKIDRTRHLVLETSHPSPLSAYRGFLGSGQFSEINRYLSDQGKRPIEWALPVADELKAPGASFEQLDLIR